MRITLLDGEPAQSSAGFGNYLQSLEQALSTAGHQTARLRLREMNIHYCTGCFGCWVKTPGRCQINDDAGVVRRAMINADLVLFCSPVSMGMVSAELKKTMDRLIPLVLPYLEFVQSEMHHRRRYEQYPKLGLILGKYGDTDDEDVRIIEQSFRRLAINFRSSLCVSRLAGAPVEEVMDEINRL
ncbi:MAG: flavodoxin family protein [Anaerolineaceae bacterium]